MKKRKRFEVVECQGTPFEIGRQYGTQCGENLRFSIEAMYGSVGIFLPTRPSRDEITEVALKHLPLVEEFDPMLVEILKGQAEGAGVPFEEVFALRCKFELGFYFPPLQAACTSFAVTGTATKDGKTIVGENYDLMYDTTIDLVRTTFPDGSRQLAIVLAGGAAGELPITSHGLGMALNVTIAPVEDHRLGVPCSCVMPLAMRQKTIGDALGVICRAGRSVLYYALASEQGDIIGVETKPEGYAIINAQRDIITHSNHYLTERFKPGELIGIIGKPCTYLREPRLRRLLEKDHGDITVESIMDDLTDHNNHPCAICAHPNPDTPEFEDGTLCSFIMVPEDRKMWVAWRNPCEYEYEEYDL